ncbi:MAG: ABC transporter substrate-binding protein [Hyphomicrobiales bacterium]
MTWHRYSFAVVCLLAAWTAAASSGAFAEALRIESWRSDDREAWTAKIIPAFAKRHPDIEITFTPTAPTEYNASLNARLAGGTAGDLITCRPFDAALTLFKQGHLVALDDLPGMEHFAQVARSAWQTDDGKTTFCLPMASVIHGFIYNKDAFKELGLKPPQTEAEFFALLEAIKKDGGYTPLAMGTADQWEAATMGFQNVGPNFWKGEDGRRALISGDARLTDAPYVATLKHLARWSPYMGRGYKAQSYADSQTLFSLGRAAIYPAGSWDITTFRTQATFELGAFKPPPPDGTGDCYISDHTDIGIGINAASPNKQAARTFLTWMATPEFATLFANALPGFFPLSSHKVTLDDDLAQEFIGWRATCKSTIRNAYQILSRGTPNLDAEIWNVSAQVLNGTMSPEDAAAKLEAGLAQWYAPHQK